MASPANQSAYGIARKPIGLWHHPQTNRPMASPQPTMNARERDDCRVTGNSQLKGQIVIADDFDELPDNFAAAFGIKNA